LFVGWRRLLRRPSYKEWNRLNSWAGSFRRIGAASASHFVEIGDGRIPSGTFRRTQARTTPCSKAFSIPAQSWRFRTERAFLEVSSYRPECQRHGGSKTRVWGLLEARRILDPMPAWRHFQSRSTSGALVMSQRWVEGTSTGSALPGRSLDFRTHARASVWGGAGLP
jgi:hypothetical protein